MNIEAVKGHRVRYIGTTDAQVNWGNSADPRGILTEGQIYVVDHTEIHSWHTKVFLMGYRSDGFPSVAFEDAGPSTPISENYPDDNTCSYCGVVDWDSDNRCKNCGQFDR